MKWLRYLAPLLAVLPIMGIAAQARADIAQPDSAPTIVSLAIYRDLLEPNDRLFRIYANIPYAHVPVGSDNATVPVSSAYLWRLMDGTNDLGSNTGYVFYNYGYGYNVFSLYFDNVTSITWEGAYTLQLIGTTPGFTTTTPTWSFTIPASAWSTDSDQADEQAALTADVLSLSAKLDSKWSLDINTTLLTQSDTGAKLSMQGEYFWNGAIPGLQGMAPKAYSVELIQINTTTRTWSADYTNDLGSQWAITEPWLATAQQGGADFFSLNWDLLSTILVFGIATALVLGNIALTQDGWNGLLDCAIWVIFAGRMGLYGLAFLGLIEAIAVIWISYKIWGIR
jgi:hypothetical protein